MRHSIEAPLEPRISLDLSLMEFAGLMALHQRHGGGDPQGLRGKISKGFEAVRDDLDPVWRSLLPEATDSRLGRGYTYEDVEKYFRLERGE